VISEPEQPTDPKITLSIRTELTSSLYKNLPPSIIAILFISTILFWELSNSIANEYLIPWYMALFIVTIFRFILFKWYNYTKNNINLQGLHYYLFLFSSTITGLLWGTLGSFLMPNDIGHQTFILVIISGLLAGSVLSLGASYLVSMVYILCNVIPLLAWEILQIVHGNHLYIGIFILMLFYCIYASIIAHHGHAFLVSHIKLKFENANLLKNLLKAQNELQNSFEALKKYNVLIKEQAIHDLLTGLFNRRYLEEYLTMTIAQASRNQLTFGLIFFDIDHFKIFNDTFGHEIGDRVLHALGMYVSHNIRSSDMACRYGGEEFVIVFPETPFETILERAELLRKGVKSLPSIKDNQSIKNISISIGVALYPDNGTTGEALLRAADKAMYQAKQEGRDRICIAKN